MSYIYFLWEQKEIICLLEALDNIMDDRILIKINRCYTKISSKYLYLIGQTWVSPAFQGGATSNCPKVFKFQLGRMEFWHGTIRVAKSRHLCFLFSQGTGRGMGVSSKVRLGGRPTWDRSLTPHSLTSIWGLITWCEACCALVRVSYTHSSLSLMRCCWVIVPLHRSASRDSPLCFCFPFV